MARYIDAEELYRRIKEKTNPYGRSTIEYESGVKVLDMIESQPTADVQEGRHGVWRIMSEDPFDETNAPTERGYYRVIDDCGEEHTNFFFGKPTLIKNGVVWWLHNDYIIRAWAKIDGGNER